MIAYQYVAMAIDVDGYNLCSEQFCTIEDCMRFFEDNYEREIFTVIDISTMKIQQYTVEQKTTYVISAVG